MTAEAAIAAIDNGGSNTAAEVRTALTEVLARADAGATVDDTEPPSPVDGQIWLAPTSGITRIWDDGNSEWVVVGSGGAPTAMGDLSGLFAWYDASQLTGLSHNDPLTTWPDLSGNSNDLTTSVSDPVYETGVFNGLPAIFFSSSADRHMDSPAFTAVAQPGTVVVVASSISSVNGWTLLDGQGASNRWNMGASASGSNDFGIYGGSTGPVMSGGSFGLSVLVAFYWTTHSALWRTVTDSYEGDGNGGTNTLTGIRLARHQATTTRRLNGYVCELGYYDRILQLQELGPLVNSLESKWGI